MTLDDGLAQVKSYLMCWHSRLASYFVIQTVAVRQAGNGERYGRECRGAEECRAPVSPSGLSGLVSPFGIVGRVQGGPTLRGLPMVTQYVALVGAVAPASREIAGVGSAVGDPRAARTVALAEAAERYVGLEPGAVSDYRWARAADLDDAIVDPTRIPLCTDAEYAAPGCPLTRFDADAKIRWCRGIDLYSGEDLWVPAVMAVYGLRDRVPAERFWHSISTGYAVHTDPFAALCAAICEVIERDIIEVLWSQRLPLPLIAAGELNARSRRLLEWAEDHFLTFSVFDATSDMAVPTAYCLQIAEHDPLARQLVSCATGITLGAAAEKAVLDGISLRNSFGRHTCPVKTDFRDFTDIDDGTRFMALAERASAFDFLTAGCRERVPAARPGLPQVSSDRLGALIGKLADRGFQAVAVDRTTKELAAAGLTAVCAFIPDLQPMTLHPLARFHAHPRLYEAPVRMGYRALPETELNPWPQPFA